ncbi:helix-turn-helix transcriptional regulator [Ferrimonas balearica]|nr:helix-turn-helix transcriptional regulator [Ferrimonas balearica]
MLHDSLTHPIHDPSHGEDRWKERVFTLWDELADFEASRGHIARNHLLQVLSDLVGATNAEWIGFMKLDEAPEGDPMLGWRPRLVQNCPDDPVASERIRQAIREMERGKPDQTAIRAAQRTGQFRIESLDEMVEDSWFESRGFQEFYADIGRASSLWICIPVCDRAEVHLGLHRGPERPAFGEAERSILRFCLRGLRWFYRQQMLNEGIGVVQAPLTEAERMVLRGLLDGLSEKAIAEVVNQSRHTTHGHVKRIFRKYGVRSRSELMALWLRGSFGPSGKTDCPEAVTRAAEG